MLFEELSITRIYEHLKDCVVLLFILSLISHYDDIIMFLTYISPQRSGIYNESNNGCNGISLMQENIEQIKSVYSNAMLFVAGAFNAIIRDVIDFIPDYSLYYIVCDTEF